MLAVIVRPVDRERLPIGVAAIVLARVAGLARRGLGGRRRRRRFRGLRHDRGTRHGGRAIVRAGGRRGGVGGSRRVGCLPGGVTADGRESKKSCKGDTERARLHGRCPCRGCPPAADGGRISCRRYFAAVLLTSILTTWTRRLAGSIGAFAS